MEWTHCFVGLQPLSNYRFMLMARNDLGKTGWTPPIVATTQDAPEDAKLIRPAAARFDPANRLLTFEVMC